MAFTRDLRPTIRSRYNRALNLLQVSERTRIGHVDTGISKHPALGFDAAGNTPDNLLVDLGKDFLDPGTLPFAPLGPRQGVVKCITGGGHVGDCLTDFPDHGTKTLSVILSDTDELNGVAPDIEVIPVRIADGPIFQTNDQRNNMGPAIRHLLGLTPVPRVISISMGNPGFAGAWQPFFSIFGTKPGFGKETRRAFDAAYQAGVIVVCAAGQIIDRVIYPARYKTTIAVGGIRQDGLRHYPADNYDIPDRVDIWAQADGINRAVAFQDSSGVDRFSYAEDDPDLTTDDVSGTSYATPQVAAAAALWVETFFHQLPQPGDVDGWKTVEAFRSAVTASADRVSLKIANTGRRVERPRMNIHRLLGHAPVLPADEVHAPETVRFGRQP